MGPLKNWRLPAAACRSVGPDAVHPPAGSLMYAHDAELERQWASLDSITADALEESRINWELAGVICARMDASRRSTEKLLGVLQVGCTCMPPALGLPQAALAACTPQPGPCRQFEAAAGTAESPIHARRCSTETLLRVLKVRLPSCSLLPVCGGR